MTKVGVRMKTMQAFDAFGGARESRLAQHLVREESSAHPDLVVDAPDQELDTLGVERLLPREDVLIDVVDERSVEIEGKHRPYGIFRTRTPRTRLARTSARPSRARAKGTGWAISSLSSPWSNI